MSWVSWTPAARPGPQAAGGEPGVTVDHQPQLSWPGLPLDWAGLGSSPQAGRPPPHPRPPGEFSPARSQVQNRRSRELQGGAKRGIPAHAEEGQPQPRARRARILLKPGLRRGCLCPYRENHTTCAWQTPKPGEVGRDAPPPTPEPSDLESPLAPVTPGSPLFLAEPPTGWVSASMDLFGQGGVGWGWTPSPPARSHSRLGFRWRLQSGPTCARGCGVRGRHGQGAAAGSVCWVSLGRGTPALLEESWERREAAWAPRGQQGLHVPKGRQGCQRVRQPPRSRQCARSVRSQRRRGSRPVWPDVYSWLDLGPLGAGGRD